jgi:hypothetical protein
MRVSEEPVCIDLFRQNPVFTSLHLKSPEAVDTNGRFQMQGGKNWIFPKYINANRFFWDSHWLEIWSNNFCPSMGLNGGSVATDSVHVHRLSSLPAIMYTTACKCISSYSVNIIIGNSWHMRLHLRQSFLSICPLYQCIETSFNVEIFNP